MVHFQPVPKVAQLAWLRAPYPGLSRFAAGSERRRRRAVKQMPGGETFRTGSIRVRQGPFGTKIFFGRRRDFRDFLKGSGNNVRFVARQVVWSKIGRLRDGDSETARSRDAERGPRTPTSCPSWRVFFGIESSTHTTPVQQYLLNRSLWSRVPHDLRDNRDPDHVSLQPRYRFICGHGQSSSCRNSERQSKEKLEEPATAWTRHRQRRSVTSAYTWEVRRQSCTSDTGAARGMLKRCPKE